MKKSLIYILFALYIISCSEPKEKLSPNVFVVSATEVEYTHTDTVFQYQIDITYPVIDANFSPQVLNKINNTISEEFNSFIQQQDFINAYKKLPVNPIDPESEWMGLLTNEYSVHQADSFLFISFSIYQYFLGAAHGFSTHHSLNFNVATGDLIHAQDFFKTDGESQKLVTQLFNENLPDSLCWGIQNDSTLTSLISNFTILPDSIQFTIDDYALCPYAFGVSKISFSQAQFQDILRIKKFSTFSEINPVVDEGEIATH
ncbi:MAG: hypothetical protein ACI85Q_000062 [Salibacteraceae bacterium]|jgi:hypothetical protein